MRHKRGVAEAGRVGGGHPGKDKETNGEWSIIK